MSLAPEILYQVTDLARHHRGVVEAGRRPGGTMIRDKDGEALLLAPAGPVKRERYALEGLKAAVRVLKLLGLDQSCDPLLYGSLTWLAVLPREDQTTFIWEYVRALQAVEGAGTEAVEELLYEWQQTARAWADDSLRAELTGELNEPLSDVEL
ncbi:MAG: hypothetical protein QG671_125 [Actinomycetota bacterium]|nr:hypothetical protein [Actinomycetota bacterium]